MTFELCNQIAWIPAIIAIVFSWITTATEDWRFYIPTVLFALVTFGFGAYAFLFLR